MTGGALSTRLTLTLKGALRRLQRHAVKISELPGCVLPESQGQEDPVHGGHRLLSPQLFLAEIVGYALHGRSIPSHVSETIAGGVLGGKASIESVVIRTAASVSETSSPLNARLPVSISYRTTRTTQGSPECGRPARAVQPEGCGGLTCRSRSSARSRK